MGVLVLAFGITTRDCPLFVRRVLCKGLLCVYCSWDLPVCYRTGRRSPSGHFIVHLRIRTAAFRAYVYSALLMPALYLMLEYLCLCCGAFVQSSQLHFHPDEASMKSSRLRFRPHSLVLPPCISSHRHGCRLTLSTHARVTNRMRETKA